MSELKYVHIDKNLKDMDKLEEIYSSAFPPEERFITIREAVKTPGAFGKFEFDAVYDDDELIGFYSIAVHDEQGYKYLHFLATDPAIRGKGYGSRILRKILEDNKDVIIFAAIEEPKRGDAEYAIKARRQQFYERNGMISSDKTNNLNGVNFIYVTNKTGEKFERCLRHALKEEEEQAEMLLKKYGDR